MEELFLYIILALGGVLFFQKRKIGRLENEAVDAKDAELKHEQQKVQEEKKNLEKEASALKPKPVDEKESAEDYWKDKL